MIQNKLEELPDALKSLYDKDSLIYDEDDHFYYNEDVDKDLIEDILNKDFQIYNGTYRYEKDWNSPKIYLIGRGRNCGKKIFKIENFKPYCYIESEDGEYKTNKGKTVEKIIFETEPRKVADLRRKREKIGSLIPYEADIIFVRRFLIDTYDFFQSKEFVEPKICVFDVETNFPENNDLIAFSVNGYDGRLYYSDKHLSDNKWELALNAYDELLNYDIVTGWNIDFDIKSLSTKIQGIKLAFKPLEEKYELGKEAYIKKIALDYNIFGLPTCANIVNALLDYEYLKEENGIIKYGNKELRTDLNFIFTPVDSMVTTKKMYARQIQGRWSLDNAGEKLGGIGKHNFDIRYPRDMTHEQLLEYNVIDTIIPEILDNYLGGTKCHVILAWMLQSILDDVMVTAVVNDIALLRAYHKDKVVLSSRPPYSVRDKEDSYNAAEPDARPGVYDDIAAGDLDSAYPRTVMSLNASCETKDPNGKYIAPNGVRFNDKYSTFVAELRRLVKAKKNTKNKLKELEKGSPEWDTQYSIYFAIKTQVAAFSHGIFGWSSSRMKDKEIADAITSMPREIIELSKQKLDEIGHPWVYAHTDSTYFKANKEEAHQILKEVNKFIEKYCNDRNYNHIPYLDFEGYFPKAYIHSPARNVLVDEKGNWKPTGMNYTRSEVPEPLRYIEKSLIAEKLKGLNNEQLLEKLGELIEDLVKLDPRDIGITKPLNKPIKKYGRKGKDGTIVGIPYHITALQSAKDEYGFDVNVGEKFMVIPILTDETEGVRVIKRKRIYMAYSPEEGLPDMYEIDWENYFKSNLWGKICKLFDTTPSKLEKKFKEIKEWEFLKEIKQ
jgi:DNA polymerase elongation subunit (family B)